MSELITGTRKINKLLNYLRRYRNFQDYRNYQTNSTKLQEFPN